MHTKNINEPLSKRLPLQRISWPSVLTLYGHNTLGMSYYHHPIQMNQSTISGGLIHLGYGTQLFELGNKQQLSSKRLWMFHDVVHLAKFQQCYNLSGHIAGKDVLGHVSRQCWPSSNDWWHEIDVRKYFQRIFWKQK